MTFADHLRTHQDATVRTAAQWCRAGPIDLADALRELDAVGAPGVAFLAIREVWREWRRAEVTGKMRRIENNCCYPTTASVCLGSRKVNRRKRNEKRTT